MEVHELGRVIASNHDAAIYLARFFARTRAYAGLEVHREVAGRPGLVEVLRERAEQPQAHKRGWCNIQRRPGRPSKAMQEARALLTRNEADAHADTGDELLDIQYYDGNTRESIFGG